MTTDLADYNRRSWKHSNMLDYPMERGLSLWELKHIRDAANHSYWCDCPQCLRWWAVRFVAKRPREDGSPGNQKYMGPFSWETIEDAHRIRCWERVCERKGQDGTLEMFVSFTSPSAKDPTLRIAYCGGGDWQTSGIGGICDLDIMFVTSDIQFAGAVSPIMASPRMIGHWYVVEWEPYSYRMGATIFERNPSNDD